MRRTLSLLFVLSLTVIVTAGSGCYHPRYGFGPPPPAYACDSYGYGEYGYGDFGRYGAFGGYGECVDDGQGLSFRESFRERRQLRRANRRSRRGGGRQTINGLPVMAAYIMPIGDAGWGGCGCGCDPCGGCMSCGDGFPCGGGYPCSTCCPTEGMPCTSCGEMGGCPIDGGSYGGEYLPYESGEPIPSPAEPNSGTTVPEGSWQGGPPVPPQTFTEPAASRPIGQDWLPAGL